MYNFLAECTKVEERTHILSFVLVEPPSIERFLRRLLPKASNAHCGKDVHVRHDEVPARENRTKTRKWRVVVEENGANEHTIVGHLAPDDADGNVT